jgi:hypothetical protein
MTIYRRVARMRPVMEVCQISHAATYQYRGARDRCYFKQIDCCVSPVFVRVVSKKVVSEEYIDVTRIKKPATSNPIGRKRSKSIFIISLNIHDIRSLACDPKCDVVRPSTSRHITKSGASDVANK